MNSDRKFRKFIDKTGHSHNTIQIFRNIGGSEIDIVTFMEEEVINFNSLPTEGVCKRVIIKPLKVYYHGDGGGYIEYATYLNCRHELPDKDELQE